MEWMNALLRGLLHNSQYGFAILAGIIVDPENQHNVLTKVAMALMVPMLMGGLGAGIGTYVTVQITKTQIEALSRTVTQLANIVEVNRIERNKRDDELDRRIYDIIREINRAGDKNGR